MFHPWLKSNNLEKYCAAAACVKAETQKETKRFNTSWNTTKLPGRMRYSQIVRR